MGARKKVVIAGGGFAGVQLAENLDHKLFDVLLVDKLNHHQFQPLFYQVATSQLEPASITFPFRHVFGRKRNLRIRMAHVEEIDIARNRVLTSMGSFPYDILVIATGCTTHFFGNREIGRHVFTLKTTYDAIRIRNHIIRTFEQIISAGTEELESMLNLVIVGAGPTGVELAGAFAEIKKNILPRDYPGIDFSRFRIYLIEGSPDTLGSMSALARKASRRYLEAMGVTILTGTLVKNYDGRRVELSNGGQIFSRTVIWAAGITGNLIPGLPAGSAEGAGRIRVDRFNRVDGLDNIYAVGDIAWMETPRYPRGHPQVANVAINQAKNLARNLKRMEHGRPFRPYEYRDLGSMATIGRNKAVVDLPFLKFKGLFAWLVWMLLHLMLILSVRNKLVIFINWAWAYLFKDSSLRLILEPENIHPREDRKEPGIS